MKIIFCVSQNGIGFEGTLKIIYFQPQLQTNNQYILDIYWTFYIQ